MAAGNGELWERITRLEALFGGTNYWEDLVDLLTQIKRVNAELTLTKEVLNKKVLLLEAEYASKHKTA